MRGAGGVPITSPRLFSARKGATDDVAAAVRHLRARRGAATVFAVSWSNGGTVINNYVAEQVADCVPTPVRWVASRSHRTAGVMVVSARQDAPPGDSSQAVPPSADARLDGAVTINTPLSFRHCAAALGATPYHRWAYDFMITSELTSSLRPARALFAAAAARGVPTHGGATCAVDLERVLRCTRVGCIDAELTARVFDHASVRDYYATASSDQRLGAVRVPLMLCQTLDDPIATSEGIFFKAHLFRATTRRVRISPLDREDATTPPRLPKALRVPARVSVPFFSFCTCEVVFLVFKAAAVMIE
jgi:predicted alpha/beta-fold hydrolase